MRVRDQGGGVRALRRPWLGLLLGLMAPGAGAAAAAPISIAGFSFADGERAFADEAILVSGLLRHTCVAGASVTPALSISEALSGSDVSRCVNNNEGDAGVVEIRFTDNAIRNGVGPDLVIFELSGPLPAGTPDPRERFEVSLFDGTAFSPFLTVDPVATGVNTVTDPTLDVFAVQVDLAGFGMPTGATVDRLRLHVFDVGLGTASADVAALGALQSVPEASSLLLVQASLALLLAGRLWPRSTRPGASSRARGLLEAESVPRVP
jgi:hypothetical protein